MEPAKSGTTRRGPQSNRKNEALVALNFRVPFEFRQRIKLAATTRGVTMTQLVSAALENYLAIR
jgi:predicted HicB family RNase H-like nuclease